ncbi:hypothetical protein MMC13_004369 [Lambiella insularis]|nr:hypothetical protein [Lambiella insularis]
MNSTVEAAVSQLTEYAKKSIKEVNAVIFNHKLTVVIDTEDKVGIVGCDVKEGILRILFKDVYIGSNVTQSLAKLQASIEAAGYPAGADAPALPLETRMNIRDHYETKIGEVQSKLAKELEIPDIKLTPNFEINFAFLKKNPPDSMVRDWEKIFGQSTLTYFGGLADTLENLKVAQDDMVQEGIQEALSKGEISLRLVDKLVNRTYNEVIFEDGILYIHVHEPPTLFLAYNFPVPVLTIP